jgi:hypothetical protein
MRLGLALLICLPSFALSDPVTSSLRPMPRPSIVMLVNPTLPTLRPKLRPVLDLPIAAKIPSPKPRPSLVAQNATVNVMLNIPHPKPRPADLGQHKTTKKPSLKGSVCGNSSIRGQEIPPIRSQVKGCGINEAVRVTEVDGISLSPAATLNCGTAKALDKWVKTSVQPTFGAGQVVRFQVAASYSCRGRNNVKGARVSEHGRGNAIDIAAFILADGTSLTVAQDYNKTLRKVHKGACGIFGTTLGPGSDGYHENHIHLDIARYRGGAYCR